MNLQNLKIGTRLGIGFGLLLLLMMFAVFTALNRMSSMQDNLNEIVQVNNVEADLLNQMRKTIPDRANALRNLVLLSEIADMKPEAERVQTQGKIYLEAEAKLNKMFDSLADTTPEEKAYMLKIKDLEKASNPYIAKIIQLGLDNEAVEATRVLLQEYRPIQKKWLEQLDEIIAFETALNVKAAEEAHENYIKGRNRMFGLMAISLLAGVAIAWFITKSITVPINKAVQFAETVAAGDLSQTISSDAHDEVGTLLQAMKNMSDSLIQIVSQVRSGTDAIATASSQIATGNLELSARTEDQASSLEETASSMEEMTSTVKQNADNARQANTLASSASDVAEKGGAVVAQVVATMDSINDSSKKIVDIISVIDGIAFQTNILALNAAVEAARAGEQGRGFAVVASEVRNLAQRSAAAAKEIKELISHSVEQVSNGSKLVNQAGTTMDEVVASVKQVSDIISEITAASGEQSAGIEQINQAVMQMDNTTQQNAALVEQAAAAAGSLQEQAENLAKLVSVFKIDTQQSGAKLTLNATSGKSAPVKNSATPKTAIALARPKPVSSKPVAKTEKSDGDWEEF
jgi:methyl-accepting chemotaxis protein